jgi:O-phospho-L-seryl-tRNASec:L-selenocysteinyl-tRNA synthase
VQSCDKNFQTPVGGAVISTFKRKRLDPIAAAYPGRASMVPARDMLLTLLHQGRTGFIDQLQVRMELYVKLQQGLRELAEELDERLLDVPDNDISLALTLGRLPKGKETLLGGMLFARGVTGARCVCSN